jgi:hypothetical protein
LILVLIDSPLQTNQARKIANATIDLTIDRKPTAQSRVPDTGEIIPPSPPVKQKPPTLPIDAPTLAKAAINSPAPVHTYKWSPKPTAKINTHIHNDLFLKTISTEYPGATPNITLTCKYTTNPQATLTAALHILGTTLPEDILQPIFQYDLTKSSKTLAAFLKEHNADKHFQFEDYNAAVADRNLTPGLEALFLGHSGPNFGGATCFNNSQQIRCQMDCEAPKSTNQRQTFQWALFFPHMNTVMTCHERIGSGKTKHAWVLGSDILDFFKDNNSGRIDQRMGKIYFPTQSRQRHGCQTQQRGFPHGQVHKP